MARRIPTVAEHETPPVGVFYQHALDQPGKLTLESEFEEGIHGPIDFYDSDNRFYIPVAGISRPERIAVFRRWVRSKSPGVRVEREPANRADPNAVAVHATWIEKGKPAGGQLGYLPREVAAQLAIEHCGQELGARVACIFMPGEGKAAGVRLFVGASGAKDCGIDVQHGFQQQYAGELRLTADTPSHAPAVGKSDNGVRDMLALVGFLVVVILAVVLMGG